MREKEESELTPHHHSLQSMEPSLAISLRVAGKDIRDPIDNDLAALHRQREQRQDLKEVRCFGKGGPRREHDPLQRSFFQGHWFTTHR
jgi:hypothetical protein